MSPEAIKELIRKRAQTEGFDVVRVTRPDAIPEAAGRLRTFIEQERYGTMDWMPETEQRRADPRALWPDVKSIVMLGMNYGPDCNPLDLLDRRDRAAISVYARNRDYHDVMKGRLKQIVNMVAQKAGVDLKVFVDTAPVMEKPLAAAAGLGWQGKHTNLVSRELGSWLFLGAIFLAAELPADEAEMDHCGSCRKCLDICPTHAFPAPYQLDARKCISYLTIEHKGPVPRRFRHAMKNRIYGCDDCLAICPWNKFAQEARETRLQARDDLKDPHLTELSELDDPAFRALFSGSPVKRIGRDRFLRNVMIALGNSRDPDVMPWVERRLGDDSALVRGAAVWAFGRLEPEAFLAARSVYEGRENDPDVLEEWHLSAERIISKQKTASGHGEHR
ncbi:tRNA epoxyqueuosine(34) reductase QueG [Coralliovum pocilloporae]|uniref:tRNA epoxyqueuosine(34) reductase QueG n=1 Tax=Coralliovum pocilloporae TaxID=3066369 RepID=UPI003306C15F